MTLLLTRTEIDLLRTICTVVVPEGDDEVLVDVSDMYFEWKSLSAELERRIEFQESDAGDWLRAQEWRKAKETLLSKIRKATFHSV